MTDMHKTVHKELATLREAIERPKGKWKIWGKSLKSHEDKSALRGEEGEKA